MAPKTKICPICGKTPRLRNDGSLYRHKNTRGVWCGAGARQNIHHTTVDSAAPPTTTTAPDLPDLSETIDRLLVQAYDDLTRNPARAWDAIDSGVPPLKVHCPMCARPIGWRFIAGSSDEILLARHKHPKGGWCSTSRVARPDNDNGSGGITGHPIIRGDREPERDESPLAQWWRELAEDEIAMVVAKANEYGATDLRDLGYQILDMAGKRPSLDGYDTEYTSDLPTQDQLDAQATEIGIAFYTAGKLARIIAAVKEGRRPSYDSWHDVGVYARMAQRVHTHGGWPA